MSEDALMTLLNYDWYGNIREVENIIEMLVVLNENGLIVSKDIPQKYFKISASREDSQVKPMSAIYNFEVPDINNTQISLKHEIEKIELEIIRKAMKISGGIKEKAAKMLGLNRTTLIEKLKRYEKNNKYK